MEELEKAQNIIARRIVWRAVHNADVMDDWGDYPEIGEFDWGDIVEKVENIADWQNPSNDEYNAAYKLLSDRCEKP
jgi:hypothetical protein